MGEHSRESGRELKSEGDGDKTSKQKGEMSN